MKIGFIDYYIDEWHANNYPGLIAKSSVGEGFEVSLAWEETCPPGKRDLEAWCAQMGIGQAASLEEVVGACDCLVVLSPDNPERHEDLADLPLRSGKPVYIDKPFAPSFAAAERLFAKAADHGTPLMSCSALRYGSVLQEGLEGLEGQPQFAAARGGGEFSVYAIHQIEMLVMAMGTGALRVMQAGGDGASHMLVDYGGGRRASATLIAGHPFEMSLATGKGSRVMAGMDDFFPRFIDAMLVFFSSGESKVAPAETLEIAALLEAGNRALGVPDVWVDVPGRG